MICPFEWLDSFKTNVDIAFSSQYKAIRVSYFFFFLMKKQIDKSCSDDSDVCWVSGHTGLPGHGDCLV